MVSQESRYHEIIDYFSDCDTQEAIYAKIMDLGKRQEKLTEAERDEKNLVRGCQTQLYLVTRTERGLIFFKSYADALISSGLSQILIWFYSGLSCEEVLKTPPTFLDDLKIPALLTPSRSNGLYSIHLRMKQEALIACSLHLNR